MGTGRSCAAAAKDRTRRSERDHCRRERGGGASQTLVLSKGGRLTDTVVVVLATQASNPISREIDRPDRRIEHDAAASGRKSGVEFVVSAAHCRDVCRIRRACGACGSPVAKQDGVTSCALLCSEAPLPMPSLTRLPQRPPARTLWRRPVALATDVVGTCFEQGVDTTRHVVRSIERRGHRLERPPRPPLLRFRH